MVVLVDDVVASLGLVDVDFALGRDVVEVLLRVDAGVHRSRPAGGVDAGGALVVAASRPVHQQRNCVLGALRTPHRLGDAHAGARPHSRRPPVSVAHEPFADVDVVRVQVVGNVRLLSSPRFERLELRFRLRHVAVEVVEVAEVAGSEFGVLVCRVEALVMLDVDEHLVLLGQLDQFDVVRQQFRRRLGDHDVNAAFNRILGDVEVGRVRREDGDGGASRKSVNSGAEGFWIGLIVRRE